VNEKLRKFERESKIDIYSLGKDRSKWESRLYEYSLLIVNDICDMIIEDGTETMEWVDRKGIRPEHYNLATMIKKPFEVDKS